MATNCCDCPNLVKTTNVEVSGSNLILTIPNQTINNGQELCIFTSELPTAWTGNPPSIIISVNGTKFLGVTGCGSYLYADQFVNCNGVFQTKQIIKLRFATDSNNAVYVGNKRLCKSAIYIPPSTAPSA